MSLKTKGVLPPRENAGRARAKATGAGAVTYLSKSRLHEPLEKPGNRKLLTASTERTAAARALRTKRRAVARAGAKRASSAEKKMTVTGKRAIITLS